MSLGTWIRDPRVTPPAHLDRSWVNRTRSWFALFDAAAIAIACDRCGAAMGQRCTSGRNVLHASRSAFARAYANEYRA